MREESQFNWSPVKSDLDASSSALTLADPMRICGPTEAICHNTNAPSKTLLAEVYIYCHPFYKITFYQKKTERKKEKEKRPGLSFSGCRHVYPALTSPSQGKEPVPRQLSIAGNQIAQSYRK